MSGAEARHLPGELPALKDTPDKVDVDGKTYDIALRFKRIYKPYSMHLVEVRFDKYMGTNTSPRTSPPSCNWSIPAVASPDRRVIRIWMNNPLRYAGETFYQSTFNVVSAGRRTLLTGLQVVTNTGWMIPYVSCMIVAIGMLAHFSISLGAVPAPPRECLHRGALGQGTKTAGPQSARTRRRHGRLARPVGRCAVGRHLDARAWPARAKWPRAEPDLDAFGRLPLMYEGRHKPFDTLARNSLRVISDARPSRMPRAKRSRPSSGCWT